MQIREQLENIVNEAVAAAITDGSLDMPEAPAAALERPRDAANGDWASTVAMRSAKLAHKGPRDIAQTLVDHLPENDVIASAEIAGPGFINFRLSASVLQGVVAAVRQQGFDYGRGQAKPGRINLEYVSAKLRAPCMWVMVVGLLWVTPWLASCVMPATTCTRSSTSTITVFSLTCSRTA